MINDKYEKIINEINTLKDYDLIQRLNDLSNLVIKYKENDSIIFKLDIAPDGLTVLEKTLVCVALYWLYEDVKEAKCTASGTTQEFSNKGANKVVRSLAFPNKDNKNITGKLKNYFFAKIW